MAGQESQPDTEPEAIEKHGEELVPAVADKGGIVSVARKDFDPQQVALIKAAVMPPNSSNAELGMFLEMCGRYDLDPFAKQIWAVKYNGERGPLTIMVSRDGLLFLADRSGEFEGMDGDIVRANDKFRKFHGPDGLVVEHEVTSGSEAERGEIVGAWAVVTRVGRRPTYFYAMWGQYVKDNDKSPWKKQKDAMILKVAESMALRKAFVITGVVGEDEMEWKKDQQQTITSTSPLDAGPEIDWPDDEALTEILREKCQQAGWRRAKIRMKVNACSSLDDFTDLIKELDTEINEGEEVDAEVVAS